MGRSESRTKGRVGRSSGSLPPSAVREVRDSICSKKSHSEGMIDNAAETIRARDGHERLSLSQYKICWPLTLYMTTHELELPSPPPFCIINVVARGGHSSFVINFLPTS